MTYAKFEQAHTDDERWIIAGAEAFALHVAAVVYCDRQLSEGHITDAMARRVCLAVPTDRAPQAVATLVEHGFWRAMEDGYVIERFHEHALPAEQVKATRERWKKDKDRRRQHALGDHSLCKDPKFCPVIRERGASTMESTVDSTGGGSRPYQTRPDQTRPDRREGSGDGKGTGGSASSDGSAPLAASSAPPPPWAAEPPADAVIYVDDIEVNPNHDLRS